MAVENSTNFTSSKDYSDRSFVARRIDDVFRMQNESVLKYGLDNDYEYGSDLENKIKAHLRAEGGGVFDVTVSAASDPKTRIPVVSMLEPYFREVVMRQSASSRGSLIDNTVDQTYFDAVARNFDIALDAAVAVIAYGIRHEDEFLALYTVKDASDTTMTDPLLGLNRS